MSTKGLTNSKSPVSGLAGITHDASDNQFAHSIAKGLHSRPTGARQKDVSPNPDVEPLHEATVADVARAKYNGDQQGGNQHKAQGFGADLSRGSATRLGQGKKTADANKLEDCGGY
jgi:hypothetical protein